jgi:hypothetical protein
MQSGIVFGYLTLDEHVTENLSLYLVPIDFSYKMVQTIKVACPTFRNNQ